MVLQDNVFNLLSRIVFGNLGILYLSTIFRSLEHIVANLQR